MKPLVKFRYITLMGSFDEAPETIANLRYLWSGLKIELPGLLRVFVVTEKQFNFYYHGCIHTFNFSIQITPALCQTAPE